MAREPGHIPLSPLRKQLATLPSTYFFHDARLPLGKGRVAPQLVVDELHLDLDPPLRLLAAGVRGGRAASALRSLAAAPLPLNAAPVVADRWLHVHRRAAVVVGAVVAASASDGSVGGHVAFHGGRGGRDLRHMRHMRVLKRGEADISLSWYWYWGA